MNKVVQISAVIITYNEQENIGRCIDSLRPVCDEIVVVDSFSRDHTKRICEAKGVRFIEHSFRSHIQQKNFAIRQAEFDYVLSLDADEYLSPELIESILEVKANWNADAYQMKRLSMFGGKWITHGDWYPDRKIRLLDRRAGQWGGYNPHDKIILKKGAKLKSLEGDILHMACDSVHDVVNKIQRYSDIYSEEHKGKKSSSVIKILLRTCFAFFHSYIIKRGFLDGFEGLMVSAAVSNHVLYKYAKLYEANRELATSKNQVKETHLFVDRDIEYEANLVLPTRQPVRQLDKINLTLTNAKLKARQ